MESTTHKYKVKLRKITNISSPTTFNLISTTDTQTNFVRGLSAIPCSSSVLLMSTETPDTPSLPTKWYTRIYSMKKDSLD